MPQETLSATLTVAVPAERVFATLADPKSHVAIDGTGWLRDPVDPTPLTQVGQRFRMDMYHANHPNGDYQVVNEVRLFDAPRTISWRTGDQQPDGTVEFGGWFWRYDLTPVSDSETEIKLTYDWSAVSPELRDRIPFPPFDPSHLTNSLNHLAQLVEPAPQP